MICYDCNRCNKCGMYPDTPALLCCTCGNELPAGIAACPVCGTSVAQSMKAMFAKPASGTAAAAVVQPGLDAAQGGRKS